jgi:hypothetical protein
LRKRPVPERKGQQQEGRNLGKSRVSLGKGCPQISASSTYKGLFLTHVVKGWLEAALKDTADGTLPIPSQR